MFRMRLAVGLTTAALLAGCIPSLHPLYTEEDLVFEDGLVGVWEGVPENGRWSFEQAGDKAYKVTYVADGKPGTFEGRLLRIGEQLFLDLYPKERDFPVNDYYMAHLVPAHTFLRVDLTADSLTMRPLDYQWLADLLGTDPKAVAHERIEDDMVVLTAQPKDLQAFVRKHLANEEAFGEAADYRRSKEKREGEGQTAEE